MQTLTESEQVLALASAHRIEVWRLQQRIELLHAVLREHGIEPPQEDPRLGASDGEHYAVCVDVVQAAYTLLEHLDELREMVGSGAELLRR